MSTYWTLSDIKTQLQVQSGLNGSIYAQNLTPAINRAIQTVWHRLTSDSFSGEAASVTEVSVVANQESFGLTDDIHQVRGIFRQNDSSQHLLEATQTTRSAYLRRYGNRDTTPTARPGYYWYEDDQVFLRPIPSIDETIEIHYSREAPVLVADTDVIRLRSGMINPVIAYSALYLERKPQERIELEQRAKRELDLYVPQSQQRDQYPDRAHNYIRSGDIVGYGY